MTTELTPVAPAQGDTVSLTIAPDVTFDQWVDVGRPILNAATYSPWYIGDWLLYAEQRWATNETGDEITAERARIRRAVADVANVDLESLRAYRWVAGNIAPTRRRAGVSWSHHQQVAALAPEVADPLLEQAETEGWSMRELRQAVKQVETLDVDEAAENEAPKPLRIAMRVIAEEADRAAVEELVAAHVAQLSKQLARRKVTATVEVA